MLESHLTEEEHALLPLMVWAQPIIEAAQNRVLASLAKLAQNHPNHLNPATLEASVRAAFVRPIIAWSQRTLILELSIARHYQQLEGETPQARFADFVAWIGSAERQRRIATDYPQLRKDIRLRCRQVASFLIELLTRVARDLPHLAALQAAQTDGGVKTTGPLLYFKTQIGNRHSNGKSVTELSFANTCICIYYKPHSVALDLAYSRLLAWLAQNAVQPIQRSPATLDRGNYGYVAQVRFQHCENASELNQYYWRFGGLAALTYALGSSALQHTNLIAAGAWPVMINLETLFQPSLAPRNSKNAQRPPLVASALLMPQTALFSRTPIHTGTDQMKIVVQPVAVPFATNVARLQDELVQPYEHTDAICAGFEQTYRGLLAHKTALLAPNGPLAACRTMQVRAILREDPVYEAALMALIHPNHLESEDQRERLIARLRPANVSGEAKRRAHLLKTPLLRCWPSERLALLRGDVPYFTAQVDSVDGRDEQGEIFEGLFSTSAWSEAERFIKGLSPRDLQHQLSLVRTAVESTRPPAPEKENHCHTEKA